MKNGTAYLKGWQAGQQGKGMDSCPYHNNHFGKASQMEWMRGWIAGMIFMDIDNILICSVCGREMVHLQVQRGLFCSGCGHKEEV